MSPFVVFGGSLFLKDTEGDSLDQTRRAQLHLLAHTDTNKFQFYKLGKKNGFLFWKNV